VADLERRIRRWAAREQRLGSEPIGRDDPNREGDDGSEADAFGYRRLRTAMIDAERRAAVELRDRGIIGGEVLRRIERDPDLEVMLLEEATLDGQGTPLGQAKRAL
jgi:hypothetical protein